MLRRGGKGSGSASQLLQMVQTTGSDRGSEVPGRASGPPPRTWATNESGS